MKILHRHVLGSHLLHLGMTLLVFTFVFLSNVAKDVVALLSNPTVGPFMIGRFFILLLPSILCFTMPMALLAATLLVMGRISADNELTASRACGVSFFELVLPILGIAAALSFVCLYVNNFVAPMTKYRFNQMFVDIAFENPIALLEEGKWIQDFDGYALFIGHKDIRRKTLEDVRVRKLVNNDMTEDIHAERGTLTADRQLLTMRITLFNARVDKRDPSDPDNIQKRKWNMRADEYPIELDMTRLVDQRRAVREIHHYNSLQLWKQALEYKSGGTGSHHPTPILVEIQKRIALALACISFVLVALPLGVQVHRRETSIGILLSLVLAIFYWLLILFAEGINRNPKLFPELVVWLPNLIFQATGLFLLWRQSRV